MVARDPIITQLSTSNTVVVWHVGHFAIVSIYYVSAELSKQTDPHLVGAFHNNNKCWSNKGGGRESFKRRPSLLDVQEISHQWGRFYMELKEEVIPKREQPYLKLDCSKVQTFWVATQAKV